MLPTATSIKCSKGMHPNIEEAAYRTLHRTVVCQGNQNPPNRDTTQQPITGKNIVIDLVFLDWNSLVPLNIKTSWASRYSSMVALPQTLQGAQDETSLFWECRNCAISLNPTDPFYYSLFYPPTCFFCSSLPLSSALDPGLFLDN